MIWFGKLDHPLTHLLSYFYFPEYNGWCILREVRRHAYSKKIVKTTKQVKIIKWIPFTATFAK